MVVYYTYIKKVWQQMLWTQANIRFDLYNISTIENQLNQR